MGKIETSGKRITSGTITGKKRTTGTITQGLSGRQEVRGCHSGLVKTLASRLRSGLGPDSVTNS